MSADAFATNNESTYGCKIFEKAQGILGISMSECSTQVVGGVERSRSTSKKQGISGENSKGVGHSDATCRSHSRIYREA